MRCTDNSDCERPDVVTKLVQINRVATRQFSFDLRRDCNLSQSPLLNLSSQFNPRTHPLEYMASQV